MIPRLVIATKNPGKLAEMSEIIVGMGLAILMARFRVVERGLLPWLIVSQTVPLIALAPLVMSWGGRLHIGGLTWQRWMSVSVIAAFLAFFPIAIGALQIGRAHV